MDNPYYEKLINAAFRFVSFRPRSEKEFRDFLLKKLQKRKIENKEVIEKAILRFRELGYIDDAKFVAWWVEQRSLHRPKGERLLKQELLSKGVDRKIIEEQMPQTDQKELAKKTLKKIQERLKKLPILEQKKKIYNYLGQRGFDSETIVTVIDDIVDNRVQ